MNPMLQATVLTRLRLETRDQHDAVERTLRLMDDDLSCDDYRHRLQRFYGYYKPVEERIFSHGSPLAEWLTLRHRIKTPWLKADLIALGRQEVAQLPVCGSLPPLRRIADYFGCMYVLEGATLGAVLINRHVQQKLGIMPQSGGQFFNGYGKRTGAMWLEFRNALTAFALMTDEQDAIVLSARVTFRTLQQWCEEE